MQKDPFCELCNEAGILVWQDFPLSCCNYIDDHGYLDVLEQESTSIIQRLKKHLCLTIWCGGNELLNNWSGMAEQLKAVRLLNSQCFKYDPDTPFFSSSPLYGLAHGGYTFFDKELNEDVFEKMFRINHGSEKFTAFAEFGIHSPAPMKVLKEIIPEDELWPPVPGKSWEVHHGFGAWAKEKDSWPDVPGPVFGPFHRLADHFCLVLKLKDLYGAEEKNSLLGYGYSMTGLM